MLAFFWHTGDLGFRVFSIYVATTQYRPQQIQCYGVLPKGTSVHTHPFCFEAGPYLKVTTCKSSRKLTEHVGISEIRDRFFRVTVLNLCWDPFEAEARQGCGQPMLLFSPSFSCNVLLSICSCLKGRDTWDEWPSLSFPSAFFCILPVLIYPVFSPLMSILCGPLIGSGSRQETRAQERNVRCLSCAHDFSSGAAQ